jgi:hypothetical protein
LRLGSKAEALDRSGDVIGALCPFEWLKIVVGGVDIGLDRGFKIDDRVERSRV